MSRLIYFTDMPVVDGFWLVTLLAQPHRQSGPWLSGQRQWLTALFSCSLLFTPVPGTGSCCSGTCLLSSPHGEAVGNRHVISLMIVSPVAFTVLQGTSQALRSAE
jgi:hypothetical protein